MEKELKLKDPKRDNGQYWYEKDDKKISVVDFGKFMSTANQYVRNSGIFLGWEAMTDKDEIFREKSWEELRKKLNEN